MGLDITTKWFEATDLDRRIKKNKILQNITVDVSNLVH